MLRRSINFYAWPEALKLLSLASFQYTEGCCCVETSFPYLLLTLVVVVTVEGRGLIKEKKLLELR